MATKSEMTSYVEELLFQYADEHGLLTSKEEIENFNNWVESKNLKTIK